MTQRPPLGQAGPAKPYDRTAVARAILSETAAAIAPAMLPYAETVPTGSVTLNQIAVPRASLTAAISLTFPTDGLLVGIRATTEDGSQASMAGTLLRVQVNGRIDLFSSGASNGAGYMPFSQISGFQSLGGRWSLRREFLQANAWTVYIQNTLTGTDIVADLSFDVIDCRPQI